MDHSPRFISALSAHGPKGRFVKSLGSRDREFVFLGGRKKCAKFDLALRDAEEVPAHQIARQPFRICDRGGVNGCDGSSDGYGLNDRDEVRGRGGGAETEESQESRQ